MLLGADGTVAGTESAGYDIRKHSPCEAEQDMEYLWQRTRQSIAALLGISGGRGSYPGYQLFRADARHGGSG